MSPTVPRFRGRGDGDGAGGDIVILTGIAHRAEDAPAPHENSAFMAKYGSRLLEVSEGTEASGKQFAVPLRIEITRTRGL
jgi:hypothetical protein